MGSTRDQSDASPLPSQSVPSGAERTVPIECESMSAGMQSAVFDGAGHGGVPMLPRITVSAEAVLLSATVTRVSRDVRARPPGCGVGLYTYRRYSQWLLAKSLSAAMPSRPRSATS